MADLLYGDGEGRSADDLARQILEDAQDELELTQQDVSKRLGLKSDRTYRNWKANLSELSASQIEALADAHELSEVNRANLFHLTRHQPPLLPASEVATAELVVYQRMIDGVEHPTVVYGASWDVVLTNRSYRQLFGVVRRHPTDSPLVNTTRFILFHPDAYKILGGTREAFYDGWLMPSLANFSGVLGSRPGDRRLRSMEKEINQNRELRNAYRDAPRWLAKTGDLHVNSSPRPMFDPRSGRLTPVHCITTAHPGWQAQTIQLAVFVFPPARRDNVAPQMSLFPMNGLIRAQSFAEPAASAAAPVDSRPELIRPATDMVTEGEGAEDADAQLRDLLDGWRKARGMSQMGLVKAVGLRSDRSYRNWMIAPTQLKVELLGKFAKVLAIDDDDRDRMYRLAGHLPPPRTAAELRNTPAMNLFQKHLDGLRHPSHLYDARWDMVLTNDPYRDLFGAVPGRGPNSPLRNGLRFILFDPDAPKMLGAGDRDVFHSAWLMPALANFAGVLHRAPENPDLLSLEQEIIDRPELREAYGVAPRWLRKHGDIHVSQMPRPLLDPRTGKVTSFQLVTEAHHGYQRGLTHVTFVPMD